MWAVVFVAIAASQITAAMIQTRLGGTIFDWVCRFALIVLGVRQATLRWSDQFDGGYDEPRRHAGPAGAVGSP